MPRLSTNIVAIGIKLIKNSNSSWLFLNSKATRVADDHDSLVAINAPYPNRSNLKPSGLAYDDVCKEWIKGNSRDW